MEPYIETHAKVKMPRLIYGTAWKKDRTLQLVKEALDAGFVGIDTACQPKHYNEPQVGEGFAAYLAQSGKRREDFFIQTKFTSLDGQDPQNVPYDPGKGLKDQVQESFLCSLKNLRVDYLDSWVLHGPLRTFEDTLTVWRAMEAIAQRGQVGQLGVSNFYDPAMFARLIGEAAIKPAVLQNRFYRDTSYDVGVRKICTEHNIIYQSFWTLTANPQILGHPRIQQMSAELQKTTPQVFFRYLSQKGIVPLTGTTDRHHMDQDLGIFDFELSPDQAQMIDELLK